ncbi:efflux RND transporter periplasmic adaptor subunit [Desulfocurvus sp.]|jgi:RND family efflux transporter MFP subunit|uniref:efflux RND transporter periplasmic adaptor subunit n=1 Tax=Desulfocurvus sp. TaxID=2871698 RepID=UPI0025B941B7|nr:efflux RND transporter periplasmic adaptor subunit [Desulfocurvus sp.]
MKRRLVLVLGSAVVLLVVLWQAGALRTDTIAPGPGAAPDPGPEPGATTVTRQADIDDIYEAVGTIRPRTETSIEAQVTARIVEVRVREGDFVKRGEVLVVLDDREHAARADSAAQARASAQAGLEQARQGVSEAKAAFDTAAAQYKRIKTLFAGRAVAQSEMDQAEAAYLQAEARLSQAREAVAGAQAALGRAAKQYEEADIARGYTVIRAPEDMEVARRTAEPGDLAVPGRALLVVQTAGSLRLEAFVREGLVARVRPGTELPVAVGALERTVPGVVEEVVPAADPTTRTFLVKVGLPDLPGGYPGMFGRLLVPAGRRPAVLLDARAVVRTGQLETVRVRDGDAWRTVLVRTVPAGGGEVEVLAGLEGGQTVALPGGAP